MTFGRGYKPTRSTISGTSIVAYLLHLELGAQTTLIKTVGALPAQLPPLSLPDFSYETIHKVLFPALIITLLALTEAVSISRAVAARSGQNIDGNQEFIGQGLSNLVGSFFSSYASCGSFNRSGVNYAAGAKTPMATVYASIFLVLVLLLVAPLASYLPTAAMAGILFLVAWGLIDFHHISSIGKTSRSETVVLWVTLLGTLVDLEKGIFFGILLSLAIYLFRVSRPNIVPVVPAKEEGACLLRPERSWLFLWSISLLVAPRLVGEGTWQVGDGYHFQLLAGRATSATAAWSGFTLVSPGSAGVGFSNGLPVKLMMENNNFMNGSGVAAGDIDGDGWCDLYCCAISGTNALYRNLGAWRFEDITARAGVGCPDLHSTGALLGDVDGDGDLDLLVATLGHGVQSFVNDGSGGEETQSKTHGVHRLHRRCRRTRLACIHIPCRCRRGEYPHLRLRLSRHEQI